MFSSHPEMEPGVPFRARYAHTPGRRKGLSETTRRARSLCRCPFRRLVGGEMALVGGTLRHEDRLNAAVLLSRSFLARFSDPCGNPGGVYAFFTEELLYQFGAFRGQSGCSRFLGIGITDNHDLGGGFVLQT